MKDYVFRAASRVALGALALFLMRFADASDLSLDDLVNLSLQASPAIRSSEATLRGSAAASDQARWMRYPNLSLDAENRVNGSGDYPYSGSQFGTTAKVSMTLWSAGRITAEIDAANLRKVSSAWALEDQRDQAALRTVSSWRSLVNAFATIETDDRVLARLSDFEAKIQRRIKEGLSAPVDLDSVVAKKMQISAERSAASAQLQLAVSRLALQTGSLPGLRLPQDMQSIEQQITNSMFNQQLPEMERVQELAHTSPIYLKAITDSRVAELEMAAAKARLFPEIQATYQYQPSSSGYPATEGLFLSLSYQTGNGLSTLSQINSAVSRFESLTEAADNALLDAADAVISDIQDYNDALLRTQQNKQAVEKSLSVLDSNLRLFDAGKRNVFEILSAITELAQNEKGLAPLQAQLIAAHYSVGIRLGQHSWQTRRVEQ